MPTFFENPARIARVCNSTGRRDVRWRLSTVAQPGHRPVDAVPQLPLLRQFAGGLPEGRRNVAGSSRHFLAMTSSVIEAP
jgi:hypothetical protein